MKNLLRNEGKDLTQIKTSVNQIKNVYLYNNEYERKAIKSFYEYYERDDFKELFMNLVHGMEAEDIAMIVKILQRQRRVKEIEGKEKQIYLVWKNSSKY